jgi:hypothetical protein
VPSKRKGQDPLPERCRRKNALGEIERRLRHLASQTRGAESSAATSERDQSPLAAVFAQNVREAPAQKTAVEIAVELLAHELRKANRDGPVVDGPVERREVVPGVRWVATLWIVLHHPICATGDPDARSRQHGDLARGDPGSGPRACATGWSDAGMLVLPTRFSADGRDASNR